MRKIILLGALCLVMLSCGSQQKHVVNIQCEALPVTAAADSIIDQDYVDYLAPTKAFIDKEMSIILGYAPQELQANKKRWDMPLLIWATETLWEAAKQHYPGQVDIAIVNRGGVRKPWKAGDITKGHVFEMMPFDNKLVVLTLKGDTIMKLCESFIEYGGHGIAGMRVVIRKGKVEEVTIGGKPLDPEARYTVATSDYLAGGADHLDALKMKEDIWKSDLVIRDLYLDAVLTQKLVTATVDDRLTIEP